MSKQNSINRGSASPREEKLLKVLQQNERMRAALVRIEKWFGEFPSTGQFHADGKEMSYGLCYGSNGERDYMRSVARKALEEAK